MGLTQCFYLFIFSSPRASIVQKNTQHSIKIFLKYADYLKFLTSSKTKIWHDLLYILLFRGCLNRECPSHCRAHVSHGTTFNQKTQIYVNFFVSNCMPVMQSGHKPTAFSTGMWAAFCYFNLPRDICGKLHTRLFGRKFL